MGVTANKPHPYYEIAHKAPLLKCLEITPGNTVQPTFHVTYAAEYCWYRTLKEGTGGLNPFFSRIPNQMLMLAHLFKVLQFSALNQDSTIGGSCLLTRNKKKVVGTLTFRRLLFEDGLKSLNPGQFFQQ